VVYRAIQRVTAPALAESKSQLDGQAASFAPHDARFAGESRKICGVITLAT